jgi:DNA-binding response OmpR family regulator
MGTSNRIVLIIEDEEAIAQSYERCLRDEFEVRVAHDGESGLEQLDKSVDVVLLDRMMPGMSGSEVLDRISERPESPRIAMVTAMDPDFDIIEMPFDEYVTKPPDRDELRETVADLCAQADRESRVRRYRSLLSRKATLVTQKPTEELHENESFSELCEQIDELETELEDDNEALLDDATFASELRRLTEDAGDQS